MLDGGDATGADIKATVLTIAAGGSIGLADNTIETNLTGSSLLNATAGAGIFVHEIAGDLYAGDIETDGDAALTAAGSIWNQAGVAGANITAKNITLTATGGSIGATGSFIEIDMGNAAVLIASAQGSIYIIETSGDMTVDTVTAQTGSVTLQATVGGISLGTVTAGGDAVLSALGSILDGEDTPAANITAVNISLTAGGSIGAAANRLDINAGAAGTLTAAAASAVNIIETSGNMNVDTVTAGTGDVYLKATAGNIQLGTVQAGGNASLTASGSILDDATTAASIIANNIALTATSGGIGTSANYLYIKRRRSGHTGCGSGRRHICQRNIRCDERRNNDSGWRYVSERAVRCNEHPEP